MIVLYFDWPIKVNLGKPGGAKPSGLRDHPPTVARLPKVAGPPRLEAPPRYSTYWALRDGADLSADLAYFIVWRTAMPAKKRFKTRYPGSFSWLGEVSRLSAPALFSTELSTSGAGVVLKLAVPKTQQPVPDGESSAQRQPSAPADSLQSLY